MTKRHHRYNKKGSLKKLKVGQVIFQRQHLLFSLYPKPDEPKVRTVFLRVKSADASDVKFERIEPR